MDAQRPTEPLRPRPSIGCNERSDGLHACMPDMRGTVTR